MGEYLEGILPGEVSEEMGVEDTNLVVSYVDPYAVVGWVEIQLQDWLSRSDERDCLNERHLQQRLMD